MTEQVTDKIDIFELSDDGLVTSISRQTSAGTGPFSLNFARGGVLVVTEADSASVSTYHLGTQNALRTISGAVPDGQTATCWISSTGSGHAFVSNTASATLSSYQISADGTVNLADPVTASLPGGAPIDSALSSDSKFLYVEDSALGRVVIYDVNGTNLSRPRSVSGLPQTLQGIVAH